MGTVWGGCGIVIEHMLALNAVSVPPHSGPIVPAIETSGLLPQAYYPKAVIRCLGERALLKSVQAVLVGRAKNQGENAHLSTDRETYRSTQHSAIAEAIADYLDPINIIYDRTTAAARITAFRHSKRRPSSILKRKLF